MDVAVVFMDVVVVVVVAVIYDIEIQNCLENFKSLN
jgi:hypothetical protein